MATTFSHLRPRLTQIILTTLQLENDSVNTHLLLGTGLLIFTSDRLVLTIGLFRGSGYLHTGFRFI